MLLTAALFAGVFSAWAAILYFQLRHAGLTVLVLSAPLPFLIAACVLWHPIGVSTEIFAEEFGLYAYVLGLVIAQTIAVAMTRGICDGVTGSIADLRAIRNGSKVAGPVAAGFGIWMVFSEMRPFGLENPESLASAFALFAVYLGPTIVMQLARWLPYSEQFIARANQARESRERVFDRFQFIAETRWAFSIAGVGLIFFALSALGMRALLFDDWPRLPERLAALAVFVLFLEIAVTRNWRLGLALTLTLSLLGAIGLWILARGVYHVQPRTLLELEFMLAAISVPLGKVAGAVIGYLRTGDDTTLAIARGYHDECANAVLSAIIIAVPWVISGITGNSMIRLELAISIASLVAAPLIFPAFAGAIYAIFPRYRTVDEVFGKH